MHFIDKETFLKSNLIPGFFQQLYLDYKKENNTIIHLWFDEWQNKRAIIESRVKGLVQKNQKIFARNCTLETINKKEADEFLSINHLQGTTSSAYRYGLKYKGQLVGLATFSKGRKMRRLSEDKKSFELIRFANKCGFTVTGGLSKLLKYFELIHKPGDIMTYADLDWGSGDAFLKTGFRQYKYKLHITIFLT